MLPAPKLRAWAAQSEAAVNPSALDRASTVWASTTRIPPSPSSSALKVNTRSRPSRDSAVSVPLGVKGRTAMEEAGAMIPEARPPRSRSAMAAESRIRTPAARARRRPRALLRAGSRGAVAARESASPRPG